MTDLKGRSVGERTEGAAYGLSKKHDCGWSLYSFWIGGTPEGFRSLGFVDGFEDQSPPRRQGRHWILLSAERL